MIKIYDIDFSYPFNDFVKELKNHLGTWCNCNMDITHSEQATKNGKSMYKFVITCQDDKNFTTILFEKNQNNGDVILAPNSLKSLDGTFYKISKLAHDIEDTDDDTSIALLSFLKKLAEKQNGKLVYRTNCSIICIINGVEKEGKECIVDENGNVYGAKEITTTSIDDNTINLGNSFNTPISVWNKQRMDEDPEFAKMLIEPTITTIDKMYYIGKYVTTLKVKEEIEINEFKDIFIQAGLFTSGYEKDRTLNTIYKLIK